MADTKGNAGAAGAGGSGSDDLDPSILEAVGRANDDLKAAAAGSEKPAAAASSSPAATPPAATASAKPEAEDAGGNLDQNSIDDLLNSASFEDPQEASASAAASASVADDTLLEADDFSSRSGATAMSGGVGGGGGATATIPKFDLPSLGGGGNEGPLSPIDLLRDVELNVKIELGRSKMLVEDVLKLAEGSVVELDKLAGDPVDVFVNDRLVARGEVLVLNDNFCVRVNEIVAALRDDGL
jgi:flagellar motor switch protein FliN/FliY